MHSERGKKKGQTKEEVGGQHQGMDRPGVRQVPEDCGEQGKMKGTGCEIICGAPTTLAVKGYMMMMMNFQQTSILLASIQALAVVLFKALNCGSTNPSHMSA